MATVFSTLKGQLSRRRHDLQRSRTYKAASQKPLENTVLFESFQGKVIGDSPFEIAKELRVQRPDLQLLWTVKDSSVKTPDWLSPVVFGSDEWLRALATSRYLVNNAVFPWYFSKRVGQVYLQTWHGTPLKRIVNDVTSGAASRGYKLTVTREAKMWDYLIAPSEYSEKKFATAFDFHGTFLRGGYPRNDRLVNPSESERFEIRKSLGVSSSQTQVILYAPTWRPNIRNSDGTWSAINLFDVEVNEGSIVLYRGHTNTSQVNETAVSRWVDVSNYPDVNDLMIAADVLVTDYSSIMFDFSITGKPIILLAPDIDDYAKDPGLYFDLRQTAPGPVVESAQEVVAALDLLKDSHQEVTSSYRSWQELFTSEETGSAAKNAVKTVFSKQ